MLIDVYSYTVALSGALLEITTYTESSLVLTCANPSCVDFFISFDVASVTLLMALTSQFNCASIVEMVLLLATQSMHLFFLNSLDMRCSSRLVGLSIDDSSSDCWSYLHMGSSCPSTGFPSRLLIY